MEIPMSSGQRRLARKHGTPAEFARACYQAVPGFISMDEAALAVRKYNDKWATAGRKAGRGKDVR